MTAYMTGAETVCLGMEMGGDEGKDIQRNAVDGSEGILPLADIRQCGRNTTVELRNSIEGETIGEGSVSFKLQDLANESATYDG